MDETARPERDRTDDRVDVVEGPVGSASLKEPTEVERSAADLDAPPTTEEDHAEGSGDPQA